MINRELPGFSGMNNYDWSFFYENIEINTNILVLTFSFPGFKYQYFLSHFADQ